MMTLKRLSVAMSVLGMGLVAVACTSPTDAEIAGPSEPSEEDVAVSTGDEAEEADVDATSSALDDSETLESETDSVSSELRPDWRRRCDRRQAWHCRRGHPGWRWVGNAWGARPKRCCVRF